MNKASISQTYLKRTIAVAACALALLGTIWVYADYRHFMTRSEETRQSILDAKNQEIADRANEAADYIEFLKSHTHSRARTTLRQQVDVALNVAQSIFDATKDKALAVETIKNSLRNIRFHDGAGYFFAIDMNGNLMMHAITPEKEGQNRLKTKDGQGKYFVRDLLRIARDQGEGFAKYQWSKPGKTGNDHEKLAYIKIFKPLGWVIGSGLYIEDVAEEIKLDAMEWLNSRDFGDNSYIFAWRYDGTALVGPYVGRNFLLSDKPEERIPFLEALEVARNGGGYVTYSRPPTPSRDVFEKRSFVQGIEGWDWFVGSGFSTREVAKTLERVSFDFNQRVIGIAITITLVILAFVTAAYVGLRVATAGVRRDFQIFTGFFTQAAEDAQPIDTDRLTFEEFVAMARAANRMLAERVQARAELKASESRYRSIFENMTDGYYRADLQGRVTLLNPSGRSMLQFGEDEDIAGLNIRDFYKTPGGTDAFLNQLIRDGVYEGFTCTVVTKVGTHVELEVNARLIVDEETGSPIAMDGIFRDITERRRTQEVLVQSEKMQSVAGLAAGMAHEINNPLGGILQGIQNVQRRLSQDLPGNIKAAEASGIELENLVEYINKRRIPDTLDGIQDMASRAAQIVARMQTFSRHSESKRVWSRLEELANAAVDLAYSDYDLKKKYGFHSIDIVRDFDLGLPKVSVTETEIQQVLLNLLANAAQAMKLADPPTEHPRITLRTRREDDFAVLDVIDNGPGMDEATRLRVFQPFFTTREPGMGTGLGLSNAYFIITAHHDGVIQVQSEPSRGATFSILLPVSEPSMEV